MFILPLILTYCSSGWTTKARLLGNVHGVVVHAIKLTSGSPSRGKLTITKITVDYSNLASSPEGNV